MEENTVDDYLLVEEFEHLGIKIGLYYDDSGVGDPTDGDNLMKIAHWHRRYDLGERVPDDLDGIEGVRRWLKKQGAINILPLYIYDHSGITIWVEGNEPMINSAHRGWDSGQVGFVYTTKEQMDLLGTPRKAVDRVLRAEVEDYDSYLRGEVYGYRVFDDDGDEVDSCWGFLGDEGLKDARQEAIASATYRANEVAVAP
jgi:hypothetical protein